MPDTISGAPQKLINVLLSDPVRFGFAVVNHLERDKNWFIQINELIFWEHYHCIMGGGGGGGGQSHKYIRGAVRDLVTLETLRLSFTANG